MLRSVFAQNLKRYREEQGLTQEKLAEISNLHRTYISEVERCKRNISIDNIEKIANALGVEAKGLLENNNN